MKFEKKVEEILENKLDIIDLRKGDIIEIIKDKPFLMKLRTTLISSAGWDKLSKGDKLEIVDPSYLGTSEIDVKILKSKNFKLTNNLNGKNLFGMSKEYLLYLNKNKMIKIN